MSIFALLFGAIVSIAAAHWSAGYGILYQLNASFWALAGILVADTLVVQLLWEQYAEGRKRLGFLETMQELVLYDGATLAFCALSLMGGFFLWRYPDPE